MVIFHFSVTMIRISLGFVSWNYSLRKLFDSLSESSPKGKLLCLFVPTIYLPLCCFNQAWKQNVTQQPLSKAKHSAVRGTGRDRAGSKSLGPGPPVRAPRWVPMHRASSGDLRSSCWRFVWATLRAQPTICIFDQERPGASKLSILVNVQYHTHCLETVKTKSTEAFFFPQKMEE